MSIRYDPFTKLYLAYDTVLPIRKITPEKPIDSLTDKIFAAMLPNGTPLPEKPSDPRLEWYLNIGNIWDIDCQRREGSRWGSSTGAHFSYRMLETRQYPNPFEHGSAWKHHEYKAQATLAQFESELKLRKAEFVNALGGLGLLPKEQELAILIVADQTAW